MVNSVAHSTYWGSRPYDKWVSKLVCVNIRNEYFSFEKKLRSISSTENRLVAALTIGEGWHNYHHVFPWDYKAAELGSYSSNWTTALIDWFAEIGWAFDRKTVPESLINSRAKRTGDGTHTKNVQDSISDTSVFYLRNKRCIWIYWPNMLKRSPHFYNNLVRLVAQT